MTIETTKPAKRTRKKRPRPEGLKKSRWAKYGANELGLRDINVPALRDLLEALPGRTLEEKAMEFEEIVRIGTGKAKYSGTRGGQTAKALVKGGRPVTPEVMKHAIRWFVDQGAEIPRDVHLASAALQYLQVERFRMERLAEFDAAVTRLTEKMLVEAEKTPDPKFARHEIGEILRRHIPADAHGIIVPLPRPKSY